LPLLKRKETGSLSGKVLAVFRNHHSWAEKIKVKDYAALSKALKRFTAFALPPTKTGPFLKINQIQFCLFASFEA